MCVKVCNPLKNLYYFIIIYYGPFILYIYFNIKKGAEGVPIITNPNIIKKFLKTPKINVLKNLFF